MVSVEYVGIVLTVAGIFVGVWLSWHSRGESKESVSIKHFTEVRNFLNGHRNQLLKDAANHYSNEFFIPGTHCMLKVSWVVPDPVAFEEVIVHFDKTAESQREEYVSCSHRFIPQSLIVDKREGYSAALRKVEGLKPQLFWNGPSYNLNRFDVTGEGVSIFINRTSYFDMFDISEALAHEYADSRVKSKKLRKLIGDPLDLERRISTPALSWILLLRRSDGSCHFPMHARNPDAVASDGDFLHVFGGQFQPSSSYALDSGEGANLWSCFSREFIEEILGLEEASGQTGVPLTGVLPEEQRLLELRDNGRLSTHLLGLVVDPLSLWPSMVGAVVIDEFSFLAMSTKISGEEGIVVGVKALGGWVQGYEFDDKVVAEFLSRENIGMSAKACLALSWKARERILGQRAE